MGEVKRDFSSYHRSVLIVEGEVELSLSSEVGNIWDSQRRCDVSVVMWESYWVSINVKVMPVGICSSRVYSYAGILMTRIVGAGGGSGSGCEGAKLYTGFGDALLPINADCDISMSEQLWYLSLSSSLMISLRHRILGVVSCSSKGDGIGTLVSSLVIFY